MDDIIKIILGAGTAATVATAIIIYVVRPALATAVAQAGKTELERLKDVFAREREHEQQTFAKELERERQAFGRELEKERLLATRDLELFKSELTIQPRFRSISRGLA